MNVSNDQKLHTKSPDWNVGLTLSRWTGNNVRWSIEPAGQVVKSATMDALKQNIDESNEGVDVAVYPNPVKDIMNIKGIDEDELFSIYDTNGKLVYSGKGNKANVVGLNSGVYIVKLRNGKSIRIIKQ